MVVPGLAAAWLWVAPRGRLAALRQLLCGGAAMVVVGRRVAGAHGADSGGRPARGSSGTSDNSIFSLIFGYNGLGRLSGQSGGPQGSAAEAGRAAAGGGGPFGGSAGPLRLLNASLGGQAGWLLGFAARGRGRPASSLTRLRRRDARTGWLIAIGGAFAVTAVLVQLRAAGSSTPTTCSLLAPFTAALVGAGVGQVVAAGKTARILGAAAIVAGVVTELMVLAHIDSGLGWVTPLLLVAAAAAIVMVYTHDARWRLPVLVVALAALLAAPAAWAFQTLGHATSGTFPAGGPASAAFGGGPGGPPGAFRGGGGAPRRPGRSGPAGGRIAVRRDGRRLQSSAGGRAAAPVRRGRVRRTAAPDRSDRQRRRPSLHRAAPAADRSATMARWRRSSPTSRRNGGGTIATSSQSSAASEVIAGANVAGLGGFSGRESR